jgi:hypothetical protein
MEGKEAREREREKFYVITKVKGKGKSIFPASMASPTVSALFLLFRFLFAPLLDGWQVVRRCSA